MVRVQLLIELIWRWYLSAQSKSPMRTKHDVRTKITNRSTHKGHTTSIRVAVSAV